ncbi:dnaJ homolog subfamily C member 3 [Microplitis demolitor]|uniref:dnaJ homolog subfamily C member 3 n=1 Tax=Microplitis demolitor TaxID=69319 RepID=UPI0004CDA4DE|nr:dnaJ homolog subfamily C member 3 [Microplitis demolitor]
MFPCGLIFILLNLYSDVGGSVSQRDIDKHLEMSRNFLVRGQLQDALTHCHAAVDGDPNNYRAYYQRGIAYFALEKPKFALQDFDKVLELKPDFIAARFQRANVLFKQGQFDKAAKDYQHVLEVEPSNDEALKNYYLIDEVRDNIEQAKALIHSGRHYESVDLITAAIESCPWNAELRELRAECHVANKDYMNAVNDFHSATKLLSDNTEGLLKLSNFLYRLGHVSESLNEIRSCLKRDPEHKECFKFYKKIKDVAKNLDEASLAEESHDYPKCVKTAQKALKLEADIDNVKLKAYQSLCKCMPHTDPTGAVKNCQQALKIHKDQTLLCDSADAYLAAEMYDDAIRDLKEALEIDPHFQRAKELLQTAQQRQKMSESRDYYKILGVARNAPKKDIVKAYRKAAQTWHPDNFQDGEEKKRAEKKFIDIAAAKEVLTDPEKRAKFDRGEDPLDPESGKHPSGFNPFQEFHQFHGSPFQFKFQFN